MAKQEDFGLSISALEKRLRKPVKINIGKIEYNIDDFLKSSDLKQQLVDENPRKAQELFYQFRDRELGTLFVKKYCKNPEYNASAYHIAQELGISRFLGIKMPSNPIRDSVEEDNFLIPHRNRTGRIRRVW